MAVTAAAILADRRPRGLPPATRATMMPVTAATVRPTATGPRTITPPPRGRAATAAEGPATVTTRPRHRAAAPRAPAMGRRARAPRAAARAAKPLPRVRGPVTMGTTF